MAAIYSWISTNIVGNQLILTTTLYPVDVSEGMDISIVLSEGYMELVPNDQYEITWDLNAVTYTQLRWFLTSGPHLDEYEITWDLNAVTYTQLRWFYESGPHLDEYEITWDLEEVTYTFRLVEADSPDEGLDLSIVLTPAGCEMELI